MSHRYVTDYAKKGETRMRFSTFLIGAAIMLSPTMVLAQGASPGAHQIATELYGNTSNPRPSGNGVLPSLAPGPWACYPGGCYDGANAGVSVGELVGQGNADFANGTDKTMMQFLKPE
jgi:hypothetical protein